MDFEMSEDQETCMDAFDAFPRYEKQSKAKAAKQPVTGKTKTIWFYALSLIAIIVLTAFYALTPTPIELTVNDPTYDQFTSFENRDPSCDCTKSNIAFSQFATFTPVQDYICTAASALVAECDAARNNPSSGLVDTCNDPNVKFFEVIGDGICRIGSTLMDVERAQFKSTRISSGSLVARDLLTEIVSTAGQGRFDSIKNLLFIPILVYQGLTNFETPLTYSNYPGLNTTCFADFQYVSNDRSSACSNVERLLTTTISQLQNRGNAAGNIWPTTADQPSMTSAVDAFFGRQATRFANSSYNSSWTVQQAVRAGMIVPSNTAATSDFPTYFGLCAPSKCTYVEVRGKFPMEILAILIGLIGGVATVATTFVDKMLPIIYLKLCKRDLADEEKRQNMIATESATEEKKKGKGKKGKGKKGKKKKKGKKSGDDEDDEDEDDEDDEDEDEDDEKDDGDDDELEIADDGEDDGQERS